LKIFFVGNLGESKQQWYLDSGCSKHMTGDKSKFLSISFKQEGHVTYGDNNKGRMDSWERIHRRQRHLGHP